MFIDYPRPGSLDLWADDKMPGSVSQVTNESFLLALLFLIGYCPLEINSWRRFQIIRIWYRVQVSLTTRFHHPHRRIRQEFGSSARSISRDDYERIYVLIPNRITMESHLATIVLVIQFSSIRLNFHSVQGESLLCIWILATLHHLNACASDNTSYSRDLHFV